MFGREGAGKSTLMKIISGVYQKDGGELLFEGKPIEVKSIRQMQELGVSIIHQEFNLLPNRTIAQNIFLGREPVKKRGIPVIDIEEMNAKSRELLGFLGLNLDPRTRVSSLGIAQQQMIEVAKALSFKSKVLIMDEPTATLTRNEISSCLKSSASSRTRASPSSTFRTGWKSSKRSPIQSACCATALWWAPLDASEATTDRIIKMMVDARSQPVSPRVLHRSGRGGAPY